MAITVLIVLEVIGIMAISRSMPWFVPVIGIVLMIVALLARTPEVKIIIHLLMIGAGAVAVNVLWHSYIIGYVLMEAVSFWFFVRSLNGDAGKVY